MMQTSRRGFTLIEILVSLTIIGLLTALLFPVFATARERANQTSCASNMRQTGMAIQLYAQDNNGSFPDAFTPKNDWAGLVGSYVGSKAVFRCPSYAVPALWDGPPQVPKNWPFPPPVGIPGLARGYAINANFYPWDDSTKSNPAITVAGVQFPANTVCLTEVTCAAGPKPGVTSFASSRLSPQDGSDLLPGQSLMGTPGALRHQGGSNYAFVDGHVQWFRPEQVTGSKEFETEQKNDGQHPTFAL